MVSGAKAIRFKDGIAIFGYHQTKEKSIGYYNNSDRDNAAQERTDREYDAYTARKAKEDADRANGPFAYSDSDYEDRSHIWPQRRRIMGGTAIKNAKRIDALEYELYCKNINNVIVEIKKSNVFGDFRHEIIKSYRNKPNFGDIDILIEMLDSSKRKEFDEQFIEKLKCKESVTNGPVTSHEADGVQVDLIYSNDKDFDFSSHYYSYNDICSLIGRIAHKMGLKFGYNGLWYIIRSDSHVLHKLCLTKNFKEALAIMGYSYDRFKEGFDDLEDIFNYASDTFYFNPSIYLLDNRNHHVRVRDRKRKNYMLFLEWCKEKYSDEDKFYTFSNNKDDFIPHIDKFFPFLSSAIALYTHLEKKRIEAKNKLTSQMLMDHTGLSGKELGVYIAATKAKYPTDYRYYAFILTNHTSEILKQMDDNYKNYISE